MNHQERHRQRHFQKPGSFAHKVREAAEAHGEEFVAVFGGAGDQKALVQALGAVWDGRRWWAPRSRAGEVQALLDGAAANEERLVPVEEGIKTSRELIGLTELQNCPGCGAGFRPHQQPGGIHKCERKEEVDG